MPKRKPQIDVRWERSGGLILPRRKLSVPTRRFIEPRGTMQCCCTTPGPPGEGVCASITFSGLSNSGCSKCNAYNNTFLLPYLGAPTYCYECSLYDFCGYCSDTTVSLCYDAGTGLYTASIGGYTFTGSESPLAYDSGSGGDCTATAATAAFEFVADSGQCGCSCYVNCEECGGNESEVSPTLTVAFSGITDDYCTNCEGLNGTWELEFVNCNAGFSWCGYPISPTVTGPYWNRSISNTPCSGGFQSISVGVWREGASNPYTWYVIVRIAGSSYSAESAFYGVLSGQTGATLDCNAINKTSDWSICCDNVLGAGNCVCDLSGASCSVSG